MPTRTLNIKVAGVTFEGRQLIIAELSGNEPCKIVPEPENKYDRNALAVYVAHKSGVFHVGYIPKEYAAEIAPHLEGESVVGAVSEVTGGFETRSGETASLGLRICVEIPDFTSPSA